MKKNKTLRGFGIIKFKDIYGAECSLQKSSLADEDAIWFGTDDADPKVLAFEAASVGIKTTETTGWIPYPIPSNVLLSTRMHLGRNQVKKLLPHLEKFVKTGEI